MNTKQHPCALEDNKMGKVSGGSYFQYTLKDGRTLWGVINETTGDFDPGYYAEEDAIETDKLYNGKSVRTPDRKFYF